MRNNTLENYIKNGYNSIDGWLLDSAVDVTLSLGKILDKAKVFGPICEFGVWQGRYLACLSFLSSEERPVVAIDPFFHCEDRQSQKDKFLSNMQSYMYNPNALILLECDSKELNQDQLLIAGEGMFKFISVDGDHTLNGCLNDLYLAESVLLPGGIIAVDDISNMSCPGVVEAVVSHSVKGKTNLAPLLVAGNKLFMTHKKFHSRYKEEIIARAKDNNFGSSGKSIYNYYIHMRSLSVPVKFLGYDLLVC